MISADRTDDEKTIREEHPDHGFSEKKDIEAGKANSTLGSESVNVPSAEAEAVFSDDDVPDGGLRAWSVVIGVSVML